MIRKLGQIPRPCNGVLYTIRPGDTLYLIAQEVLIPVDVLLAANPRVDPNNLQVGSQICLPRFEVPACPGGFIWVVERGDTFFSIAQQTNTTVDAIMRANPQIDPNNIPLGTRLCIPGN
jgi:peptidoglycan endopeptidase LytF